MKIDEEKYAAAIPAWCSRRTLEEHMEMYLCWSMVQYVEQDLPVPFINCYRCDLRNPEVHP